MYFLTVASITITLYLRKNTAINNAAFTGCCDHGESITTTTRSDPYMVVFSATEVGGKKCDSIFYSTQYAIASTNAPLSAYNRTFFFGGGVLTTQLPCNLIVFRAPHRRAPLCLAHPLFLAL